jgi:hypothetical protein
VIARIASLLVCVDLLKMKLLSDITVPRLFAIAVIPFAYDNTTLIGLCTAKLSLPRGRAKVFCQ